VRYYLGLMDLNNGLTRKVSRREGRVLTHEGLEEA
jgi:hypothetical protein